MATSVTVWVRLKDPTPEADRMQSAIPGALPLILRMRSSDATIEEDFVFPYSPREVNIGKLSDEMVQIHKIASNSIRLCGCRNQRSKIITAAQASNCSA